MSPGYCKLCRVKEVELYGNVLNTTDERHIKACKDAGCKHPAVYEDADNPITVEHLQVYFDPEREKQDGNGFCVDNSNGSTGNRFAFSTAAAQFVMQELERMKEDTGK